MSGKAGGAVQALAGFCDKQLGDRSLALIMLGGLGEVDSAAPAFALWDLGRSVATDAGLTAHFDAGLPDLHERLRADSSASTFCAAFDDFLDAFGSRGPNEWETASDTWATDPTLALALVDRMRGASEDHAPQVQTRRLRTERLAAVTEARSALGPVKRRLFDTFLRAASLFSPARERSKTIVIDLIHVSRVLGRELAGRVSSRVEGGTWEDMWFVLESELDAYVADPAAFVDIIAARRAARHELARRVPPFVFEGELPAPSTWPLRGADGNRSEPLLVGSTIVGLAGCPGVVEGRARVVVDAGDPRDIGPGDILVAPLTDPAWTPLFVPVDGVVVDVGGQMSHAIIVSRELGRPCVVAAADASQRIPDGARIRVDGTAGTVTLLEVP